MKKLNQLIAALMLFPLSVEAEIEKSHFSHSQDCEIFEYSEGVESKLRLKRTNDFDLMFIRVCSSRGKKVAMAYEDIIRTEQGVCAFRTQRLNLEGDNSNPTQYPVHTLYSVLISTYCPQNYDDESFIELGNLADDIDPANAIRVLNKFRDSLNRNDGDLNEYFDVSFWDKLFSADYSGFMQAVSTSTPMKIHHVSRYLLSNDPSVHLINLIVNGQDWYLLAEIDNTTLKVLKVFGEE